MNIHFDDLIQEEMEAYSEGEYNGSKWAMIRLQILTEKVVERVNKEHQKEIADLNKRISDLSWRMDDRQMGC